MNRTRLVTTAASLLLLGVVEACSERECSTCGQRWRSIAAEPGLALALDTRSLARDTGDVRTAWARLDFAEVGIGRTVRESLITRWDDLVRRGMSEAQALPTTLGQLLAMHMGPAVETAPPDSGAGLRIDVRLSVNCRVRTATITDWLVVGKAESVRLPTVAATRAARPIPVVVGPETAIESVLLGVCGTS